MTDEAFLAFVQSNAPRFEIETLEKAAKMLHDSVASRRWGKPVGLERGSRVAAEAFDGFWHHYGTVKRFTEKGCILELIGSDDEQRIQYSKYAVRIVDDFEWNRAARDADERHRRVEAEIAREAEELRRERDAAIANRAAAMEEAIVVETLSGSRSVYVGAYIHACRPDWNLHEYGVVLDVSPSGCVFVGVGTDWNSRVNFQKYEIELLDERQWAVVIEETARRAADVEAVRQSGGEKRASKLQGEYEKTAIDLAAKSQLGSR